MKLEVVVSVRALNMGVPVRRGKQYFSMHIFLLSSGHRVILLRPTVKDSRQLFRFGLESVINMFRSRKKR